MISIVIPVFNERESLRQLVDEIHSTARDHHLEIELILVDDGSTDGSWEAIRQLAAECPRLRGIRFRRNFGKSAALAAGFQVVRGDPVLTLDADLQDDPREIPRFLNALSKGLDVVSGWKRIRHDPWHKVLSSRIFNWAVRRLTGVRLHDHNCGMKCYRAEVFREVRVYGELHRYIPVLAAARGFRVGELEIQHRPRLHGRSKYGLGRIVKGFLDLLTVKFLTSYSHRPQHILGTIGLLAFVLGTLGMTYLAVTWIINELQPGSYPPLHQRPLLIYSVAGLLLGLQMLTMGFVAELLTALTAHERDEFSIAETIHAANSH